MRTETTYIKAKKFIIASMNKQQGEKWWRSRGGKVVTRKEISKNNLESMSVRWSGNSFLVKWRKIIIILSQHWPFCFVINAWIHGWDFLNSPLRETRVVELHSICTLYVPTGGCKIEIFMPCITYRKNLANICDYAFCFVLVLLDIIFIYCISVCPNEWIDWTSFLSLREKKNY